MQATGTPSSYTVFAPVTTPPTPELIRFGASTLIVKILREGGMPISEFRVELTKSTNHPCVAW